MPDLGPSGPPDIDGVDLAHRYLPFSGTSGGDFIDAFPVDDTTWGLVVGDVCGKDDEASSVARRARDLVRKAAMGGPPGPGTVAAAVRFVNAALHDDNVTEQAIGRFTSVAYLQLQPGPDVVGVRLASAGHPPMLVLRRDGELERFASTAAVLGVFPDQTVGEHEVVLAPGDVALLYTDGATDVHGQGELFGEDRLADVLAGCRALPAEAVVAGVADSVTGFQDYERTDDLALLAIGVAVRPRR